MVIDKSKITSLDSKVWVIVVQLSDGVSEIEKSFYSLKVNIEFKPLTLDEKLKKESEEANITSPVFIPVLKPEPEEKVVKPLNVS